MNGYNLRDLETFGLSPKDDLADYDPLEYLAVVSDSFSAGKLDDYTLIELQKVEQQIQQAYSSLSEEQLEKNFSGSREILMNLIYLQQDKAEEQKIMVNDALSNLQEIIDTYDADAPENHARIYLETVRKDLAAGKFDEYSLAQLHEVEDKFKEAYWSEPL